ncbi:MAG: TonB-dependent receptor [Cyclobacteriaceae bacterium]
MRKFFTTTLLIIMSVSVFSGYLLAQGTTSVSGTVTDVTTGEALIGVNVIVKGTITGTITDIEGNFDLAVKQDPPLTLQISMVGFGTEEVEVTEASTSGVSVQLSEAVLLGQEIVISASRVEESILKSPVTVEKMDILAIQQAAAPNFFEQISHIKGVQTTSSSLTFNAINTRGFATIANTRFVSLVDGMDISAPLLNFPTGNLVGISELDAESVELVPGAASALYGPNAFNGILFMNSKSPFDYQGFSAQVKIGATNSDAGGSHPLYNASVRYAKSFNDKFAFKVNFSILDATDWLGTDLTADRVTPGNQPGAPNFDGMNLYGDESPIIFNIAAATGDPTFAPLGNMDLRRTGHTEEALLDNRDAQSIKGDVALHYRLSNKVEALYNYRYGGGSSIYQGSAKFVLRNFSQQFHKLELKGDNFFVRAYRTNTDDGDSYNMDALGAFVNERISPTSAEWVPTYVQTYLGALQGYVPGVPGGDSDAAHAAARASADASRNALSPSALQQIIEDTRNGDLQLDPNGGAGFIEGSRLMHGEFNYNFKNQIDWAEIQVGGNVRRYSIFSGGTIFDEVQNSDGSFDRVLIDEWGAYTQISKNIQDKLKLAASLRFDKNENFDGQFNPRFSAVYSINEENSIRASFQTGFRNPDSQSQFIWFPTGAGILVGSTEANAGRYNIHNGGAWTAGSVAAFFGSGGSFDQSTGDPIGGDASVLQTSNFDFVSPEKLSAIEIGYKGVIGGKLLVDFNYYHNSYEDFIAQQTVFNKVPVMRRGNVVTGTDGSAITRFRPYINSTETVSSDGIGLGLTWNMGQGYTFGGSYNWADFSLDAAESSEFEAGFNTPNHRFNLSLGNRNIGENIGFNVSFRWQDEFLWQSAFGEGNIPDYGVFDFQLNYKWEEIKSVIKIGGTNLLGGDYRSNIGGGFVGSQYYVSVTFDQFLN